MVQVRGAGPRRDARVTQNGRRAIASPAVPFPPETADDPARRGRVPVRAARRGGGARGGGALAHRPGERAGHSVFSSWEQASRTETYAAAARALRGGDLRAPWAPNAEWAPFYRPECKVCYCRSHWQEAMEFDEGFYDLHRWNLPRRLHPPAGRPKCYVFAVADWLRSFLNAVYILLPARKRAFGSGSSGCPGAAARREFVIMCVQPPRTITACHPFAPPTLVPLQHKITISER